MPFSFRHAGSQRSAFKTPSRRPATSRTTTTDAPRTARPTTAATSVPSQDIICAISESRGISPTVGLAFVNLSTSEAVLCQICDTQTYARTVQKLAVFEPTELLFMNTARDSQSKLYSIVEENLPQLRIVTVDRRYWAEKKGHAYVDQLAFKEDLESIKMSLEGNYFAACCFAAALSYIELELSMTFAMHSLRIKYEPSEGTMMIDLATIISLELIQNTQNSRSKDCLLGLLNETLTPMGSRLLRSNLLQPSTEGAKIMSRYDGVEELSTNEEMFFAVRQALKSFVDADRVLTALTLIQTKPTFQYAEQSINNVIMLRTYVAAIKPIYVALSGANSDLLLTIHNLCSPANYNTVESLLNATLNDDVTYQSRPLDMRNHRTYAIRSGVNSLLDIARQTYKEANDDVTELSSRLLEAHNLTLELKFDSSRHYYFRLPASELEGNALPDIFINVYRKKSYLEFQTLDLLKLNQKITDSHNEVINMSDRSVQELIDDVRAQIPALFRISEAISLLDMLATFAHLQATQDYVRPELTDTLAIKAGRHPIREKIHATKYVPNDAYASPQSRFQIITGCNMSGKSTYIRSLALMTMMAQIGSFVPAQYASFPVVHQLFARVSTDDNLEPNMSTFSTEMREMAFILRNLGPKSLVIVDELGRGTSTTDGLAISIAIAEALVDSHAMVWFVTHFSDLARIMEYRNGVVNLHLTVEMSDPRSEMKMLYKIADGYAENKHYGIALARVLNLPPYLVDIAMEVSEQLSFKAREKEKRSKAVLIAKRRQLLLGLKEKLVQAQNGRMEDEELREYLIALQREFLHQMAMIDGKVAITESERDDEYPSSSIARDESGPPPAEIVETDGSTGDEITDITTSPSLPKISPLQRRSSYGNSESVVTGPESFQTTLENEEELQDTERTSPIDADADMESEQEYSDDC